MSFLTFTAGFGVGLDAVVLVPVDHALPQLLLPLFPLLRDAGAILVGGALLGQDQVLGAADPLDVPGKQRMTQWCRRR